MILDAIGFCGIDDTVDPSQLSQLSSQYPWIEWGVLIRAEKQGTPRFASWDFLERLKALRVPSMRLAAHMCGSECEQLLKGDTSLVRRLSEEFGFRRFQINPTRVNGVVIEDLAGCAPQLRATAQEFEAVEFILQLNDETRGLFDSFFNVADEPPGNVAVLFDPSCGVGAIPNMRPTPLKGLHCGFAGGLGPETIVTELQKIVEACNGYDEPVWIDMETRIRSVDADGRDIFDLGKVDQVIQGILSTGVAVGVDSTSAKPQSLL